MLCVIPASNKASSGVGAVLSLPAGVVSSTAVSSASASAGSAATCASAVQLISAGRDGSIKTWNEKGAVVKTLRGHRGPVSVLVSPPVDPLAQFKVESRSESVPPTSAEGDGGDSAAAWGAKFASCALSSGADGVVRLWDIASGRCVRKFEGHKGNVPCLRWSWSGYAASGGADGMLRVWHVVTGQCAASFNTNAKLAGAAGPISGAKVLGGVLDDSTELVTGLGGEDDGGGGDVEEDPDPSAASSSVIVGSPRKAGPSPDRFAPRSNEFPGVSSAVVTDVVLTRAGSVSELAGAGPDAKPAVPSSGITYVDWRGDWLVCSNKSGAVRAFKWSAAVLAGAE